MHELKMKILNKIPFKFFLKKGVKIKNAKKLFCFLIIGCIVCTHAYNDYQTCHAAEVVAVGGLASVGVALLALGAIAGVGMDLDNNRRFNELSDEEKQRIENGLATNFEDVALQRGASVEHIKNWTTDLCNGVLDKTSECWGIFKDWVKDISLTDSDWINNYINGIYMSPNVLLGLSYTMDNGRTLIIGNNIVDNISDDTYIGYVVCKYPNYVEIKAISDIDGQNIINKTNNVSTWYYYSNGSYEYRGSGHLADYQLQKIVFSASTKPIYIDGVNYSDIGTSFEYFSTNTDYLEKLKGQDEDVIDVIDVTDIKNPIIESRPNSLANINWNRGTRRTNNNNDDDDNKMVTGLVPMDVWYEAIDDEQEEMHNAVVVYNDYIQNHPEEKNTYFISTTPITNINNYFNTLPVVNIPAQGTIVNNNYEYNNYNNNNVTIYQEPYNAGIIPTFPDFRNKFPFCIPFDLYEFFVVFLAEKEAPKIEIPFPIIDNTNHQLTIEHITIDLAPYEYLSDVLRVMMFILFCVGLMLLTRQLIKG